MEKVKLKKQGCKNIMIEGKTEKMLYEALDMLPNSSMFPILIYGASRSHADSLRNAFIRIAEDRGNKVTSGSGVSVVFNNDERVEFRSFSANCDRTRGIDYSHIFIDHFVYDANSSSFWK